MFIQTFNQQARKQNVLKLLVLISQIIGLKLIFQPDEEQQHGLKTTEKTKNNTDKNIEWQCIAFQGNVPQNNHLRRTQDRAESPAGGAAVSPCNRQILSVHFSSWISTQRTVSINVQTEPLNIIYYQTKLLTITRWFGLFTNNSVHQEQVLVANKRRICYDYCE